MIEYKWAEDNESAILRVEDRIVGDIHINKSEVYVYSPGGSSLNCCMLREIANKLETLNGN